MSAFLENEKEENSLLRRLKNDAEFKDIARLTAEANLVLLVPINVTIDKVTITRQFVETHAVILDSSGGSQSLQKFASLNGLCGMVTENLDGIIILSDPLSELSDLMEFANDRNSIFSWPIFADPPKTEIKSVTILRHSTVAIGESEDECQLYIISDPIVFPGCSWESQVPALPTTAANDGKRPSVPPAEVTADKPVEKTTSSLIPGFLRGRAFGRQKQPEAIPNPMQGTTKTTSTTSTDFNKFMEKMRDPAAGDLVKSIRSFISAFLESPPPSDQMGSVVHGFLADSRNVIAANPLWNGASAEELESTLEDLEKYLMNKIHSKVFAPDGQVDYERDEALRRRLEQLQFIAPHHLDIKKVHQNEIAFQLACTELQKINNYKAPRDKLVCILNCCKVIFNILHSGGSDSGADDVLPLLIYIVLKANPTGLHSNLRYIQEFRSPDKMSGEAGYYTTQLYTAVVFLESVVAEQLTIDPDEFNRLMNPHETDLSNTSAVSDGPSSLPKDLFTGTPTPPPGGDLLTGGGSTSAPVDRAQFFSPPPLGPPIFVPMQWTSRCGMSPSSLRTTRGSWRRTKLCVPLPHSTLPL